MAIEIQMIRSRRGRALAALRVFCDSCGEQIDDEHPGNYLWQWQREEGARTRVYFGHKGSCTREIEARPGVGLLSWGDISHMPIRLGANLGLDVRPFAGTRAWKRMNLLSRIAL